MRIVFWGTPEFACEYIRALRSQGHDLMAVVCQPDRPRGRGRKMAPPPTKLAARECGLPALQPENPNNAEFVAELRKLQADVFVVVAYGRILGTEVLNVPPKGCINVHYSLLPKYRGAAPVNHAIIHGEKVTGVSVIFMSERMDAGDIILQRQVPIAPYETAGELTVKLTAEGVTALSEALELLAEGKAPRIPQDEAAATYAPALTKADGAIDWALPAERLVDFVRGLNPWPVAYAVFRGERLRILEARADKSFSGREGSIGEVVELDFGRGIAVQTGDGVLRLIRVQPPGKRPMSSGAFARGRRIDIGERFS